MILNCISGVHTMQHNLIQPKVYYRFNQPLSKSVGLDEVAKASISRLLEDTHLYLQQNEFKLKKASDQLNIRKTSLQRLSETVFGWKASVL